MNMGYNQNNMNYQNLNSMNGMDGMSNMPRDNKDYMYPEIYNKFAPVIEQVIRDMEKQHGEIYMTEEMLNQMVDEAIRRSGMDNMTDMNNMNDMNDMPGEEAVPAMNYGRHRGGRYYGRHGHGYGYYDGWQYYDRDALSDIYRILFLQRIFGNRRHNWR